MTNKNNIEKKYEELIYEEIVKQGRKKKNAYYLSIFNNFLYVLTLLISISFYYYAENIYQPKTDFITLDKDNKVLEEIDLNLPSKPDNELTQELTEFLENAFEYDYINFDKLGIKFKDKMAESSYADFMDSFNGLRIQEKIKQLNGVVKPKISENLSVVNTGSMGNRFAWHIKGKILLNIYYGKLGDAKTEKIMYDIEMYVSRTTFKENKDGYLISRLNMGY